MALKHEKHFRENIDVTSGDIQALELFYLATIFIYALTEIWVNRTGL